MLFKSWRKAEPDSAAGRVPDFLGIGAQKAGTTWIHAQLARHPGVWLPPEKELHFWNRRRDQGLDWYRSLFAQAPASALAGEITPAYAILPDAAIGEIRAAIPDARLIFSIRNPVERAWSSALMALGRAEMTLGDASDQWFIDHFMSRGSRARGDYEACLRAWYAHYPPDAVAIVRFDDIVRDPRAVLARLAAHLGLDPAPFAAIPDADLSERVNAGPGETIPAHLAAFLAEYYAPKIRSLERFIGCGLAEWLEPRHG